MERDDRKQGRKEFMGTPTRAEVYIQVKRSRERSEIYPRISARDPANYDIAQKVEKVEKKLEIEKTKNDK